MPFISACLVLRNEEKAVGRCLQSLAGVVDEIIVVHDGLCNDKTLEIAKSFGAKTFILDKKGFCEAHYPFVFGKAKEWILRIDADEFLSDELKSNLRNLADDISVAAYDFFWPLWDGKKRIVNRHSYKRCFFRKDKISFLALPHFLPIVNGKIIKKDFALEHRPDYNNFNWDVFNKKWLNWAKIQAEYCLKDFEDIEKFNYSGIDWPSLIKTRRQHPLFMAVPDFLVVFFKNLFVSGSVNFIFLLKHSFFLGFYRLLVDFYIFKLKNFPPK